MDKVCAVYAMLCFLVGEGNPDSKMTNTMTSRSPASYFSYIRGGRILNFYVRTTLKSKTGRYTHNAHESPRNLYHRGVTEQKRDTLAVMRSSARLGQRRADIDRLELVAFFLLAPMGHRVGDDNSTQTAAIERLDGVAAQYAVRDDSYDLSCAMRHDRVGGLDQRPAGVGHVIDQDGYPVLNVPDQHHA